MEETILTKMKRRYTPWDDDQRLAVWILYHPAHFQLIPPRPALKVAAFNALFKDRLPLGRSEALLTDEWYGLKYSSPRPFPTAWQDLTFGQRAVCEKLRALVNDVSHVLEHDVGGTIPTATSEMSQSAFDPTSSSVKRSAAALQISCESDSLQTVRGRKRSATRADIASDGEDICVASCPPRLRKERELTEVFIPRTTSTPQVSSCTRASLPLSPPATPESRVAAPHGPAQSASPQQGLFLVQRNHGSPLWLKLKAMNEYQQPLREVAEAETFPTCPALLFRYWDEKSFGRNSPEGFVAGRFVKNNIVDPAPFPPLWSDLETHFSWEDTPTPFVSTCSFFPWILRLALQELQAGKQHGKITVVDPSKIGARGFYYARPYFAALLKKKPFTKGQWRCGASNEFLVWHEIPPTAVLRTYGVRELVASITIHAGAANMAQLSTLSSKGDFQTTVLSKLKQSESRLTLVGAASLATIVTMLGITHLSPPAQVVQLVADLIRGFGITVPAADMEDWQAKTIAFDHALGVAPSSEAQANVKLAFLEGVRTSFADWIYGNRVREEQAMLRRAVKVGLATPADVVMGELEVQRLALEDFVQRNASAL